MCCRGISEIFWQTQSCHMSYQLKWSRGFRASGMFVHSCYHWRFASQCPCIRTNSKGDAFCFRLVRGRKRMGNLKYVAIQHKIIDNSNWNHTKMRNGILLKSWFHHCFTVILQVHWASQAYCNFTIFVAVIMFIISLFQFVRFLKFFYKGRDSSFLSAFVDVIVCVFMCTMTLTAALFVTLGFKVWCEVSRPLLLLRNKGNI